MGSSDIVILILSLAFFTLATTNIRFTSGSTTISCIESEKRALLIFKQHLVDPANRLASWVHDEDCCRWIGVVCENVTGHVLELHLATPTLYWDDDATEDEYVANDKLKFGGKIDHSLLNLKRLNYLDLSNNNFEGIPIPKFFGSMASLSYLNLSNACFEGPIPHQLGNLTNMQYLDLQVRDCMSLHVENLSWLSGISQLKYLDMSGLNLSKAFDWLHVVNKLPSLEELHFSNCELPSTSRPLNPNSSSLITLDLHGNNLKNSLAMGWVFSLQTLISVDLGDNEFEGPIPTALQNLTSLKYLDLSLNFFTSIPNWLYSFSPLEFLSLHDNSLRGNIPSAIGNMTNAISLDLSYNEELGGGIPRSIGKLCNLRSLSLSHVNLSQRIFYVLEILSGCVFDRLESLDLDSCQLFGTIPESLGELSLLKYLDISGNKLKGKLPRSFGQLASLERIDIFDNLLEGIVNENHISNLKKLTRFDANGNSLILEVHPDWIPPFQLHIFRMGSRNLGHRFPKWLHYQKKLDFLDISNSGIFDSIPNWFWNMSSQFYYLNISNNKIHGKLHNIPSIQILDLSSNSFSGFLPQISSKLSVLILFENSLSGPLSFFLCDKPNKTMDLFILDLSENLLVGEIPDCWMKWPRLGSIRLNSNNFTGSVPSSLFSTSMLSANLRKNKLSGEIPLVLENCTFLDMLDFSENELNGQIPAWLGLVFPNLRYLILRSNKFHGHIPNELCALDSLRVLDLSHNNLSGYLPKCIGNLRTMFTPWDKRLIFSYGFGESSFMEYALLMVKGYQIEYSANLDLVKIIDLSENKLQGRIPIEVTKLQGLQSLNLSNNHLIGRIPEGLGAMTSLESLDFSINKLSGSIPQSMSNLTFLSYLNLSNNYLTGKIPSSTQLQSFDPSSYIGNQLCGPPLTNNCSISVNGEISSRGNEGKDDGNELQVDWFYVLMSIGFAVGFGSILFPLLLSRWWRGLYFQFLDRMWTRLVLLYARASRFHAF